MACDDRLNDEELAEEATKMKLLVHAFSLIYGPGYDSIFTIIGPKKCEKCDNRQFVSSASLPPDEATDLLRHIVEAFDTQKSQSPSAHSTMH